MGIPHLNLNKLLKGFYEAIIEDFHYKPLKMEECIQMINISIPFDEQKPEFKKQSRDFYFKHSVWIKIQSPVMPRIGEQISFDLIEMEDKYTHGIVHNVWHKFKGLRHEILIEVHPFDDEYARWQKLKEQYERRKAWDRHLKNYSE